MWQWLKEGCRKPVLGVCHQGWLGGIINISHNNFKKYIYDVPVPVLKASSKHVWSASGNHVISFFFSASRHCSCRWLGWTSTCETPEFRPWPRVLPAAVCSPRLMFTLPSPTRLMRSRYVSVYIIQPPSQRTHTCTHTQACKHTHTYIHSHTHTHTHTHTFTYIHTHSHTHTLTRTHTHCTYTHSHTHTHTHTRVDDS